MTQKTQQAPYQQRVVEEREQLNEKISSLMAFIKTESFKALSNYDRTLLNLQAEIMGDYLAILTKRISRFNCGV